MDHSDHTMGGMSTTSTSTADAASETCSGDMGGHGCGGGHGGGSGCKISMLLNYNTVDSCFISSDWKITSIGMFAGTCIGIALLAIFLEFLRRSVKEFDKYLIKEHVAKHASAPGAAATANGGSANTSVKGGENGNVSTAAAVAHAAIPPFRPNFWQQAIRAVLHTSQFTVAYFIMLLAMYYNVYVLVSIFLGILVGSYLFQYETIDVAQHANSGNREPTVCCG